MLLTYVNLTRTRNSSSGNLLGCKRSEVIFQDRNMPELRKCGAKGIRTPDLLHAMQALYQLSYSP